MVFEQKNINETRSSEHKFERSKNESLRESVQESVHESVMESDRIVEMTEAYYDQIFLFCARRLPTTQDAQDATQEVFLRLVRTNATYTDLGKPLAYLYRIARNVCTDFHRRVKPAGAELEVDIVDPSSSAGEEHLAMADAISHLDEEEQLVLELRYDQDLPVAQIAEVIGVSRFSVRRIEKRALANLEKELGGESHERGTRS